MGCEWKKYRLGDIAKWSSGGTPSKMNEQFWGGDIPWISASSMNGNRYCDSKLKVTELGLKSGTRLANAGSILLLVRGSILHQKIQVGIAQVDVSFNQDVKALDVDRDIVEPWYLLFWFMSKESDLLGLVENTGIGAGKLDTSVLQNLEVCIPPFEERARILSFAQALDDKIELNRRMNETLEGMAQALFKSWFVDFDPVSDNILMKNMTEYLDQNQPSSPLLTEGEEPFDAEKSLVLWERLGAGAFKGIPEEFMARAKTRLRVIAGRGEAPASSNSADAAGATSLPENIRQLFPAAFQETEEMGWIPEGWEVKPLDKIADYKNGLALQKFRPKEGEDPLPIVKIAQLKTGEATWDEVASSQITPECIIEDGDVVFSWSGSLMIDVWCGGKSALNQHLFKVSSANFPKWFYLGWSNEHLRNFQHIAEAKAVTMGHIKRSHLSEALCAIPDEYLFCKGSKILTPYIEKIISNRVQNKTLTKLRDTLLPKLISGEMRIEDVGKIIKAGV